MKGACRLAMHSLPPYGYPQDNPTAAGGNMQYAEELVIFPNELYVNAISLDDCNARYDATSVKIFTADPKRER